MMKKLTLLLLMLLPLTAAAQQPRLEDLAARLETNRIRVQYACTVMQPAPVKLAGELLVQGECYRSIGNGMEIYCDGATRWSVDPEALEVYIETAGGLEELIAWQDNLEDLSLTNISYLPLSDDLSAFRFDTSSLGPDWVVTDLR